LLRARKEKGWVSRKALERERRCATVPSGLSCSHLPGKASGWFRVSQLEQGIYAVEEPGHVRAFLVNGERQSALVDSGMGFADIRACIKPYARESVIVLNTHWHFDHIGGNALFRRTGISAGDAWGLEVDWSSQYLEDIYIGECVRNKVPLPVGFEPGAYRIPACRASFLFAGGDTVDLGGRYLEVIATPGHTTGSVSFWDSLTGTLFCGDLAYREEIYAHFADSSLPDYRRSMEALLDMGEQFGLVLPSHAAYPLDLGFLAQVCDAFHRIELGGQGYEETEWAGQSCVRYRFQGFSVLCPVPGTPGVSLAPEASPSGRSLP